MRVSFELGEHSSLMYLITAPEAAKGTDDAGDLASDGPETLICGDQRLSAIERVDIYANAFFFRLLDCFAEDYSATLAVVGIDEFTAIVKEYLLVHQPTEPSIFYADYYLPDFLTALELPRFSRR